VGVGMTCVTVHGGPTMHLTCRAVLTALTPNMILAQKIEAALPKGSVLNLR